MYFITYELYCTVIYVVGTVYSKVSPLRPPRDNSVLVALFTYRPYSKYTEGGPLNRCNGGDGAFIEESRFDLRRLQCSTVWQPLQGETGTEQYIQLYRQLLYCICRHIYCCLAPLLVGRWDGYSGTVHNSCTVPYVVQYPYQLHGKPHFPSIFRCRDCHRHYSCRTPWVTRSQR